MANGQMQVIGPKEEVLRRVLVSVPSAAPGPNPNPGPSPSSTAPHTLGQPVVSRLRRPVQTPDGRSEAV